MLAEVAPELAQPSDRMRALGGGRWELKAAIDAECRHGLEKLQMLLSHRDPHLTLGGLVARLVRDGLERYDPARSPRVRRTGGHGSGDDARSASTPARRDTEPVQRNAARANGGAVERRSEVERDDASFGAAVRIGTRRPSASKRHTETGRGNTKSAPTRDGGSATDTAAQRDTEAERSGAKPAPLRQIVRHSASAPKRATQDGGVHTWEAARLGVGAAWAPGRHHETEHACGQPKGMRSGRAASLAKRHGQTDGDDRDAAVGGVQDRATCEAGPRFDADRRSAPRAPVRGGRRFPTSPPQRLVDAAGRGAAAPAERSPALERHLAALNCFGAVPGSRSRYIPVAVRREVWRRDQGCCSYVDRHSGRRCGSRYRLEVDHVVPFALGGGAEPGNLRLRCGAHQRLRHAQRHAHAESVPNAARRAGRPVVEA